MANAEMAKRALARRGLLDFTAYFTPNYMTGWVHREVSDLLDAFIEAVDRRLSPRLVIQLPPRIGKSQLVSRCLPPYILGHHPDWEVVMATYNQDLADDMGRDVRTILTDPVYPELFPNVSLRKDSNSVSFMKLSQRGSYTAVGIGGMLTGKGYHVGIIDDPVKNREDADSELIRAQTWKWYQSVFRTRAAPGAGIVVLQTRWHLDDLTGKILLQMEENPAGDRWHVYSYPALAVKDEPSRKAGESLHPERWSVAEYEKLKASVDAREWSALYQQNPVPMEGIHFKYEWMKYANLPPASKLNWYVTTDFAIGEKTVNDYTVIWPFAVDDQDNIYFAPPVRQRIPAMEIVEQMCNVFEARHPIQCALENVHISKTIGPYLKKRMSERRLYIPLWEFTQSKDKLAKSASLRGRMQQGKVFFSPASRPEVEPEFLAFPAGRHDDLVDAASAASLMLEQLMTAPGAPPPPPEGDPPWSFSWIQKRIAKQNGTSRSHVPRHLNGKERKPCSPR
jgi:predicted phage terminase large subunit-like protein